VVLMAATVLTERELRTLRWVAEQYAVPMRVLAELLSRGRHLADGSAEVLARRVALRLERLSYAERRPMLGQTWLAPSRRGLRAAGLPYRAWNLAEHAWSLAHVEACARLRLELERAYPGARWESDRGIRQRWHGSGARVRLADGGLHWSDDASATGIELERHVKRPDRYRAAVLDTDPAWSAGVWWFTPPGQVELLTARLREAGGGELHQVYPLPEGVSP
jgi:hypothetical protein